MNEQELLPYESPHFEVAEVLLEAAIAGSVEVTPDPPSDGGWDPGDDWGGDIEY